MSEQIYLYEEQGGLIADTYASWYREIARMFAESLSDLCRKSEKVSHCIPPIVSKEGIQEVILKKIQNL